MIYKDLDVWKLGIDLVVEIYQITARFPNDELFGLVSQMRRAAVSIPSNIAEGSGRRNTKEFIQFLYIAKGSLLELETHIEIAWRLSYITNIEYFAECIKRLRITLVKLTTDSKANDHSNTPSLHHVTTNLLEGINQ